MCYCWGRGPLVLLCLAGGCLCSLVRGHCCCFVLWSLCSGFVGDRCCFLGKFSSLVFGSLCCCAGSLSCLAVGSKLCPAVGSLSYCRQGPSICNRHTWCSWHVPAVCRHACRQAVEATGTPSSRIDFCKQGSLIVPGQLLQQI